MSKVKTWWVILLTLPFVFIESNAQSFDLDGLWKIENKEQFELWQKMSDGSLKGYSYKTNEGKIHVSEYLSYKNQDDNYYYGAAVTNQNHGKEILFELTKSDSSKFHFSNLDHDFPNHIIYTKISESKLKVDVLGEDMQGFSLTMHKVDSKPNLPQWYLNDINNMQGEWITDNSKYHSEKEPFVSYGIHWNSGIGQTNMTGKLFGITEANERVELWQLFQYWDNHKQQGVALQIGSDNYQAIGTLFPINDNTIEVIQQLTDKLGNSYLDRHLTIFHENSFTTKSFIKNNKGNWQIQRTYIWNKN